MCLDHECTLPCNLLRLGCLLLGGLGSLLLDNLLRDEIGSDGVGLEFRVDFDLLLRVENRFVNFFQEELYLWITESHHSCSKLFLAKLSALHDLLTRYLFILVEQAEDGSLEYVGDKLILFLRVR